MSFGKTIKKLRRERDMTQERLAEILSISPQAVSRWETDAAMPDISLIAPICNLFNVTADKLLEIDISRKQENVDAICDEADKYSNRGFYEEARVILEDGINKYPDNLRLVHDLMYLSNWQKDSTGDKKYLEEAIKWGEKLLSESTVDHQRHSAIQVLCFCYRDADRLDEAEAMATSMPHISVSQEMLLSSIYSGDKQYKAKQYAAYDLLQFLSNSLEGLQIKLDSGEYVYTEDECADLRDKRIALLNLFFEKGDFGFYHDHLFISHKDQAVYYAKKGNEIKTLCHLQSAAKHAVGFITSVDEEQTSLVFRGKSPCWWSTGSKDNTASRLIGAMENSVFDFVREKEEFAEIKVRLAEYAGKWNVE